MRIQHNIMAMNAYRNYSNNTSALSKNLEKLSSGYKINRAGDDAAGLAISEKMRAQITGLETAQKNAKDGISLVQTAEGALTEVHDMLNRMVELAGQSANGTYDNEVDRANLQKEVDQLLEEINRIADSSNFNGINLLDGTMQDGFDMTSAGRFELPDVGSILGTDTVLHNDALTAGGTEFSIDLHNFTFSNNTGETLTIDIGGNKFTLNGDGNGALDADAIAKAFADGSFKDAAGDAMTAGKATIGGQEFDVTAGANGRLTFAQTDAPTTEAEEVNGSMAVTISGAGTAAGTGTAATVTSTATLTGAAANGDTINFTSTGGTTNLNLTATFDGTNWTVTGAPTGWTAAFDGTSLTLTSNTTGAATTNPDVGTITATPTGGVTGVTMGNAAFTAGTDGAPAGGASGTGDYNVSTTDITNVTAGGTDRLASTYFELTKDMVVDGSTITIGKETYTFTTDASKIGQAGYVDATSGDLDVIAKNLTDAAAANTTYTVGHDGSRITVTEVVNQTDFDLTTLAGIEESLGFGGPATSGGGLVLQIGDTSDSWNQIKVDIQDMHTKSLGLEGLGISQQGSAQAAIDKIKAAINTVSSVRGTLGATQNRLDHTINNLSVMTENIQDAESTIRDTDVAEEMMAYTKNNILVQSAQAMLAQANQVPQGVLQLLQ